MHNSNTTPPAYSVYYGSVISPESLTSYSAHHRALLAVDSSGFISWIEHDVAPHNLQAVLDHKLGVHLRAQTVVTRLQDGEFLLPGFVDTHTHAPQVPNMGSGQQYELLDWLDNVTFPMEARFESIDFAKKVYPNIVRRFIDSGTTTCCYYGSLHLGSTKVLADVVLEFGQRALVGKCNMNRNCPDNYREPSTESSVAETKALISYIRALRSDLVYPVLTPRFAISCTGDLLRALGDLARADPALAVQTHISENRAEVARTRELFPKCTSYADVYDTHGLLGARTILAHGVYLEADELALVARRGAGISHCPTSNFNLRSGMARVGEMLDRGIKVGLGTDVSGGFSPSILTAIQNASICSKMIAVQSSPNPHEPAKDAKDTTPARARFADKQLPLAALLYLATAGGAALCGLADTVGTLTRGRAFDALLVSTRPETGNPAVWGLPGDFATDALFACADPAHGRAKLEAYLERFLFCGDDRNIQRVFVQGRWIGGRAHHDGGGQSDRP